MNDSEVRGVVLKNLYDVRHNKYLTDLNKDIGLPKLDWKTIYNVFEQLKEQRLIEWHPVINPQANGLGSARITAFGVDVIEGHTQPPIAIMIDRSISVHGSSNVQIGDGNVQGISLDVEKLVAAIDHSNADLSEKAEAKSLMRKLMENKLLKKVLESWISSKLSK